MRWTIAFFLARAVLVTHAPFEATASGVDLVIGPKWPTEVRVTPARRPGRVEHDSSIDKHSRPELSGLFAVDREHPDGKEPVVMN
jgi:hypothetical protein